MEKKFNAPGAIQDEKMQFVLYCGPPHKRKKMVQVCVKIK